MLRTIIIALMLFWVDVFAFNYLIAGLIAMAILINCIVIAITYIKGRITKRGEVLTRQRLIKGGIYILMIVLIIATNDINNRIARSRAGQLIGSCEKYKQKYGEYPKELTNLAPEFIDKIPSLKYSLLYNEFHYYSSRKDRHILFYVVIPPFGTRIYNFETHEWRFMG